MVDLTFGWNAADPTSQAQMELRQRIALAMMGKDRRGFPKTLGEGLTSIGDALGEIGAIRALERQQAAYETAMRARLEKDIPAPSSVAPRADAETSRSVAAADEPAEPPAQPPAPVEPPVDTAAARSPYLTTQVDMPTQPAIAMDPASQAARGAGTFASTDFQRPDVISPGRPVTSIAPWLVNSATYNTAAAPRPPGPRSDLADGYSYPPTASLAGDTLSDVAPMGIRPRAGPSAARRDAIAQMLLNGLPPVPGVPQANPTLSGALPPMASPTATGGPSIATDINPAPAPGAQMAQAQGIQVPQVLPPPPPATRPGAPPPAAQIPEKPIEPGPFREEPKDPNQNRLEYLATINASINPSLAAAYKKAADDLEAERKVREAARKTTWEAQQERYRQSASAWDTYQRGLAEQQARTSRAQSEAAAAARTEQQTQTLGGIPQEVWIKNLEKGQEFVSGLPAVTQSIARARDLSNDKMFMGATADVNTSVSKLLAAAGFPLNPKASGTEQFKTAMADVMALHRKAIVGPGSQSEAELNLLRQSTAADAKLTPDTIRSTLEAAGRLMLQTAVQHQKQVRNFAGEDDPTRQRMVFTSYGVPMPTMVDIVPQSAVNKLFKFSNDPEVQREFDSTFHTPGLSREVLQFRRPQ